MSFYHIKNMLRLAVLIATLAIISTAVAVHTYAGPLF